MTASSPIAAVSLPLPPRLTVAGAMKDGRSSNSLTCTCTRESVALVGSAFTPTLAALLGRFLPHLGWQGSRLASLFLDGMAQIFHNTRRNRSNSLHLASLLCWTQSSTKEADKCAEISRQIVKSTKP